MIKNSIGYTDEAAIEDQFNIKQYIDGLATFIQKSKTPMTISIQGSWGTGKTSMMKMVNERVKGNVECIWFNTWQYSQFNMGDDLAFSFMISLVNALKPDDPDIKEYFGKAFKFLGGMAKQGLIVGADATLGGRVSNIAEKGLDKLQDFAFGSTESLPNAIQKMRDKFTEAVEARLNKVKKDRIVIFVDDLDRLNPGKSVELLEVMKLFLDCKNCVFVLAIDYDVVVRGVISKYDNKLADSPEENRAKGRSFFEKIIQVPFSMPVARYEITGYIQQCLNDIGMKYSHSELAVFERLIKVSVGANPRAMKRLFNSFLLLTIVVPNDVTQESASKRLLFAILCLQIYNEKLYNYLVTRRNDLTHNDLDVFVNESSNEEIFQQYSELDLTEEEIEKLRPFMREFYSAVDLNGRDGIDDDEMEKFRRVMDFTSITSTTAGEEAANGSRFSTTSLEKLKELIPNTANLADKYMQIVEDVLANIPHSYALKEGGTNTRPHICYYVLTENGGRMRCFDAYFYDNKNNASVEIHRVNKELEDICQNPNVKYKKPYAEYILSDSEESIRELREVAMIVANLFNTLNLGYNKSIR